MAADIVQHKADDMEQVGSRFQKLHDQQVQMESMIRQMYEQLRNGGWQGDAAQAFFAEMTDEVFPTLKRLQTALTTASAVTKQISQIFGQAEEEAAKGITFDGSGAPSGGNSTSGSGGASGASGDGGSSSAGPANDVSAGSGAGSAAVVLLAAAAVVAVHRQVAVAVAHRQAAVAAVHRQAAVVAAHRRVAVAAAAAVVILLVQAAAVAVAAVVAAAKNQCQPSKSSMTNTWAIWSANNSKVLATLS